MIDEAVAPAGKNSQQLIESEAAARLIARLHDSDWSAVKQAELEAWLSECIAHEVAFLRLEAGWAAADRLAVLRRPSLPVRQNSRTQSRAIRVHISAVLLLCAGIGATVYSTTQSDQVQIFATQIGGRETITLADGSQIELNTNTELRLPKGSRQATLVRGEAYFQIKHDAAHPFTLNAAGHRVVDLGTKFVVHQKAGELEVTLLEGRARIESAAGTKHLESAILSPGDMAIATRNRLIVNRKSANTIADTLSWRSGFVMFRHTTLEDAVSELNRYNAQQISVTQDAAKRVFGGKFRTTDSERFADVVGTALGLRVEHRGNEIVISGK